MALYQYQGLPPILDVVKIVLTDPSNTNEIGSLTASKRFELTKAEWYGNAYRGQNVVRIFTWYGWPYLMLVAMALYFNAKKKMWLSTALLLFIPTFLFIAGDSTRGPFIWALMILIIGFSLLRPLTLRMTMLTVVVGFGALIFMSSLSAKGSAVLNEDDALTQLTNKVGSRILLGNGGNNISTMDFVRMGTLEYRQGKVHFERTLSSIPGVQYGVPYAYELWMLQNPYKQGTTNSTPTYLGFLYIDFGIPGVIIGYFIMGLICGWSYKPLYRQGKSTTSLVKTTFLSFLLGNMTLIGPISAIPSLFVFMAIHFLFTKTTSIYQKIFYRRRVYPAAPYYAGVTDPQPPFA
ncbi:MAG: oligosaccharide repeat unit polymerase [Ardenticatenales bacterium]|nr:oligosaccharide repeat unit polymerase [Ardenticatenales bacterium]